MSRAFPIGRGQFSVLAAIVAVSGFGGGLVSGHVFRVPEAQAQERAAMSSINVSAGGLVFRAPNGRVIAKLSSDASGGVFEVFNADERPGARMRAASFGGGFDVLPMPREPVTMPPPNPYPPQAAVAAGDLGF
ncbi:MAG: hypothetical protein ACLQVI_16870 [Polyangiaceae bacterium]